MQNLMEEAESAVDALAHGADFLRFDLVSDAHFARFPERVNWISQIFFREFVDMVVRAVFGDFDDLAPNLQIAIGIGGVLDRNRNPGSAPDVLVLHAAPPRIEAPEISVVLHPHAWNTTGKSC